MHLHAVSGAFETHYIAHVRLFRKIAQLQFLTGLTQIHEQLASELAALVSQWSPCKPCRRGTRLGPMRKLNPTSRFARSGSETSTSIYSVSSISGTRKRISSSLHNLNSTCDPKLV